MSRQTATALPTGTSKCPPSQRVPTLSGTTASNSDLASLFECPVCFDYVLPPILQCQSGHLVRRVQPGSCLLCALGLTPQTVCLHFIYLSCSYKLFYLRRHFKRTNLLRDSFQVWR